MNQLARRNEPVPTLYFLGTLEILSSMLESRNDTPGLTSDEHDQFYAIKKQLNQLVKTSLPDSVAPSALQYAKEHLDRVHFSIGSFVSRSRDELVSGNAQLEELWNQNSHVTRWIPQNITRAWKSGSSEAGSSSESAVPDSDMEVTRASIEQWISEYLEIREQMTASISTILTEAEEVVEELGRPFGPRANPAARIGVDPDTIRDTGDDAETPLENLQPAIDRFGLSIGQIALDPGLSFFVQVSHDLSPADVALTPAETSELGELCQRIHTTVAGYEQTISAASRFSSRLDLLNQLATDTNWIDTALQSADSQVNQRTQQASELKAIVAAAEKGNGETAEKTLNNLPRIYNLPYQTAEKAVTKQKALMARIRGLFEASKDELKNIEHKRTATASGKMLDFIGGGFDDSELEQSLIKACGAVRKLKWNRQSEYMARVLKLIKQAEPRCEYCNVLLRWVPARPSVDEALGKLQPRKLASADAVFNALCAIAASDGSFCTEEKRVVLKICDRLKLNLEPQQVAKRIKSWLESARTNGLTTTLAQNVVDVANVKDTPLAKVLPKALSLVADADDQRDQREDVFIQRILKRL
jgi:hypothetical protein